MFGVERRDGRGQLYGNQATLTDFAFRLRSFSSRLFLRSRMSSGVISASSSSSESHKGMSLKVAITAASPAENLENETDEANRKHSPMQAREACSRRLTPSELSSNSSYISFRPSRGGKKIVRMADINEKKNR